MVVSVNAPRAEEEEAEIVPEDAEGDAADDSSAPEEDAGADNAPDESS